MSVASATLTITPSRSTRAMLPSSPMNTASSADVSTASGFVDDDVLRPVRQDAGQEEPETIGHAKHRRRLLGAAPEADSLERGLHRVPVLPAREAKQPAQRAGRARRRQGVPQDRTLADQPARQLDQPAQAADPTRIGPQQGDVVDPYPSLVRDPAGRDGLDQCAPPLRLRRGDQGQVAGFQPWTHVAQDPGALVTANADSQQLDHRGPFTGLMIGPRRLPDDDACVTLSVKRRAGHPATPLGSPAGPRSPGHGRDRRAGRG